MPKTDFLWDGKLSCNGWKSKLDSIHLPLPIHRVRIFIYQIIRIKLIWKLSQDLQTQWITTALENQDSLTKSDPESVKTLVAEKNDWKTAEVPLLLKQHFFYKMINYPKLKIKIKFCRLSFLSEWRDDPSPYIISDVWENYIPEESNPSYTSRLSLLGLLCRGLIDRYQLTGSLPR